MQTFCTFLFDHYEIQTDTDVVCLLSAVNNDSYDWSAQYKQRLFGLCLCVMYRRKWLVILSYFLWVGWGCLSKNLVKPWA